MTISTVVVGVDGTDGSDRALRWASELASAVGATVVAVHALGLLDSSGGPTVPVEGHGREIGARFEGEWCAPAVQAGVALRRELRFGAPVEVLLQVAAQEDADLIVVGSRGSNRPASFSVLGSTSHEVANRSTRPVLVVPPDA